MKSLSLLQLSKIIADDSIYISNELVNKNEFVISNQLKKSCTSIGANIREANYAESKKGFIHKLHIAIKECSESIYWLGIIKDNEMLDDNKVKEVYNNCFSVKRMLLASINTAKKNLV